MITVQIIFMAINIIMAWWHSRLIKADRPILHGYWGGGYLLAAALVAFIGYGWEGKMLFLLLLLNRKFVSDISLNLFRGKNVFYVSKTTASLVDKAYYFVFQDKSEEYQAIHLVLIVAINYFMYAHR